MIAWLYQWLPIIFGCHCQEHRSFHYQGIKFPICARCTGELIGIFCSIFSFTFFHLDISISILMMIPLLLDGGTQALTSYESTNSKRLITGVLFGFALSNLFLLSVVFAFQYGRSLGIKWQGR